MIGCGPRDDDLRHGRYYISVSAEPIVKQDSTLRYNYPTTSDDIRTSTIDEDE